MEGRHVAELVFATWALTFQIVLLLHFALRRWRFETAMRFGRFVYALSVPALGVSVLVVVTGTDPWLAVAGVLHVIWGLFGYVAEYVYKIQWRTPPRWSVMIPYLTLYLATLMFYWWPLALVYRPLWYVYAVLFVMATYLNVTSHRTPSAQ